MEGRQLEVCIVGAGPGGLQLGHFLRHDPSSLRNYAVFEKRKRPGSFFRRFPIHRMLISLNKRHTRSASQEFRMRHDWNSLLGSDLAGARPVTERTHELYPHADVLADYLADFAQEQADHIEYETEVRGIRRRPAEEGGGFELQLLHAGAATTRRCRRVVVASGLQQPNVPADIVGAELLRGYEQLPASGAEFENRSVLIWGFGNAAHETARELQKYTQEIHLLHRRSSLGGASIASHQAEQAAGLPRFAFFTHYPGDVRTVTMQIYDSYLLKALDVKLPYNADEEPVFLRCLGDKLCVWVSKSSRCGGAGVARQILPEMVAPADGVRRCAVEVGAFDPDHPVAMPLMLALRNLTERGIAREGRDFAWGEAPDPRALPSLAAHLADFGYGSVEEYLAKRARDDGIVNEAFALRGRRLQLDSHFLGSSGRPLLDVIARLRPRLAQDPLRHPFDAAIRCLGWKMDTAMYEPSMKINAAASHMFGQAGPAPPGKYPSVGADYQSQEVPGLYFAGALAHARDFRRSAGGFIHGFRYTARALHRILRREEQLGWPNSSFALLEPAGRARLMERILGRINEAAGPYQMFGELADVVLFSGGGGQLLAQYLEEVPVAYVHRDPELCAHPKLVLRFVYGRRFSALDLPSPGAVNAEFAELSAFIHPRLELIPGGSPGVQPRPVLMHALVEDVFTEWQAQVGHIDPLFRFLSVAFARVGELLGMAGSTSPW